jgi:alkaline phosphatase
MSFKKSIIRSGSLLMCVAGAVSLSAMAKSDKNPEMVQGNASETSVKNIIVMIPDGADFSTVTLSRWMNGKALTLDSMFTGTVRTSMANSAITGSAAAATAFATGYKTSGRMLGLGPRPDTLLSSYKWPKPKEEFSYKPLASVLEAAKAKGMSTGLVSTSRVTHATPAGFAVHIPDRGMDNEIMEQMVYQNIDVVLGGGERHLLPKADGGKRGDNENLKSVLLNKGYSVVTTKSELAKNTTPKVWGMFAKSHMNADVDRKLLSPEEPSLAEMTEHALTKLSKNKDGFFLMVEGSQVDWGGHANDAFWAGSDMIAFDKAVSAAKKFADNNPGTVIIGFSDHATGGMTIGHQKVKYKYTKMPEDSIVYPLSKMNLTSQGMEKLWGDSITDDTLRTLAKTHWGIELTEVEIAEIFSRGQNGKMRNALNEVVSENYTVIGWTTHGHVGSDVPLWSYGEKKLMGNIDNTEIAQFVAGLLETDLDSLTEELYVNLETVTKDFSIDSVDVNNPVAVMCKEKKCLRFPVNKNIVEVVEGNEKTVVELPSVNVWIKKTNRVYVARKGVDLLK